MGHSHDASEQLDAALEGSAEGIHALKASLVVLALTAVAQSLVVLASGSVALLGDTLHNFADALTAVPLWVAFTISRRPPSRRYTYGYGRSEDLAGIAIVAVIAASALAVGYAAIHRLLHPQTINHLGLVAIAAVIGFAGNEIAARYRIHTGRRIGSAALVADGIHARTDGFTSLAVLVGAGGVALGWDWADPVMGLIITVAIVFVARGAARSIYRRLMDAVDPELTEVTEHAASHVTGVSEVNTVRIRWIGHQLHAEIEITVDPAISLSDGHDIAHAVEHHLIDEVPRLNQVIVHASPAGTPGHDPHQADAHHHEHDR